MADDAEALPEASLKNVLEQRELKWVFVGGKGGVGKTTVSSCLAVLLAQTREKVLIISTDPAHNLSDAFRQKFSKNPTLVQGFTNLYALEVDPSVDSEALSSMDRQMGMGGGGLGGLDGLADLANAIPGIDEAMSFGEMLKLVQSMDYSVIVFDTAPTGHTLRLLQFPSTLEKGLGRLLALKQRIGGIMDQMTRTFGVGEEFQAESLLGRLEGMKAVIETVNQQFKDPSLTTFICVCIPEFLSLYETERLVQELARFEIDTHNIVINQVLFPDDADDSPLLRARVRMQQKYLDQFRDLYEEFHLVRLPLKSEEVRGADALKDFSRMLVEPYEAPKSVYSSEIARLEAQLADVKQQLAAAQAEIAALKGRGTQ